MIAQPNRLPAQQTRIFKDKIAKLIRAWLIYLDFAALVSAKVEAGEEDNPNIWEKDVSLVGDCLVLEEPLFKQLKAKFLAARKQNSNFKVAVAFPKIYKVEDGKRQFQPLFTIDLSPIFQGNFCKTGWNLTEQFDFQPVLPNLIDVAEIDEEKTEHLVTREGLKVFLEDTFKRSFTTLQEFLDLLVLPDGSQRVQYVPFLLRFDFIPYSYNLEKDLQKILAQQQWWDWVYPGHPAFEYLFGQPNEVDEQVLYAGAFPTDVPTASQASVLKHLCHNSLTAVVGPPGCGKTVSIAHAVAMIICDRALHLVQGGEDQSNLTLVTSTNNRAVQNAETQLATNPDTAPLFLSGGSKPVIRDRVLPQLQDAIVWLKTTPFNEADWQATAAALREKNDRLHAQLAQDEIHQCQRQQLLQDLDEIQRQIQTLQTEREALNGNDTSEFDCDYAKFPLDAYRQLQTCLSSAQRSQVLQVSQPTRAANWMGRLWQPLKQLWHWLMQGQERRRRASFYAQIAQLAALTQDTLFPIQFQIPLNAALLGARLSYIEAQIKAAQAWQQYDRLTTQLDKQMTRCTEIEAQLVTYPTKNFYARFYGEDFHALQQEIFQLSRQYLRQEALRRKDEVRESLELYARFLDGNERDGTAFQKFAQQWRSVYRDLSLLFPVLSSTLNSVRNLLPFTDAHSLAYVLADEAGTTPIHQLFPALVRCQKALVVGDPLQLQPIVTFSKQLLDEYYDLAFKEQGLTAEDYELFSPTAYETASAYQRAAGVQRQRRGKGHGIVLAEHFRCPPPIARLVDRLGNYGLSIESAPVVPVLGSHLIGTDIVGQQQNEVNQSEIDAVIAWVQALYALGYSFGAAKVERTIGVISPYRKQANALLRALHSIWRDCNEENVSTIHTFQGGQKAIIILSTRQSQPTDSILFLNRGPNLINVAVSRVKESLILVGNLECLRGGIYSQMLVEQIEQEGKLRSALEKN